MHDMRIKVAIHDMVGLCRRPWFLAGLFCVYAAVAIPSIALLMPPFQAADEMGHAQRANEISHGELLATRFAGPLSSGGRTDIGLTHLWTVFAGLPFQPGTKVTKSMKKQGAAIAWGVSRPDSFVNTAIYPPLLYIPAAIGQGTGRLLHLSVLHGVVLSRLLDGVVSTGIAALAIGLAGDVAPLLFTLLCLPMSLALFAAVTQDGPMIALSALAAALFARIRLTGAGLAAGSTALALAAMARPALLPFCLLPWILPELSLAVRVVSTVLPIASVLGWTALTGRITLYTPLADQVAAQTHALLLHPHLVPVLVWTTIQNQWLRHFDLFRTFVGVLGWLDTPLPMPYYAATAVMLLLAVLASLPDHQKLDGVVRGLAAAILLLGAIGAVFLLEYLSWSPVGGRVVDGVQGRYFLPIMPFLALVLPRRRLRSLTWMRVALCLYPLLSITITIRAILWRYYPS